MPLKSRVGELIYARRTALGLSLRAAAEVCKVSHQTIREIETGNNNPTLGIADQIAAALGLDLLVEGRADGARLEPDPVVAALYRALPHLTERDRRILVGQLNLLVADAEPQVARAS